MSDETTTQQLAEIEGQATEFTPPDGWQLVPLSEALRGGDEYHPGLDRYIRRIEPEPQPEPQPEPAAYTPPEGWQLVPIGEVLNEIYIRPIEIEPEPEPEPIQVREGRWRTRGGKIVQVVPTDEARERDRNNGWLWMGAAASESDYWHADGTWLPARAPHDNDLVGYLGPIEPQPEPQPEPADTADELRSEVSYVQNLLGESRQRVTHLEALVTSLRTINAAQEKAVDAAGKENTALRNQLAVAKAELTTAAAVSHQLQIELDAAQQVPADSPELQQLRLRLADMTLDRDQCKTAYDQIFADLVTIRETTTAETVEAIVEWLQPFRGCNSPALALLLLEALPDIMRHLTGLAED